MASRWSAAPWPLSSELRSNDEASSGCQRAAYLLPSFRRPGMNRCRRSSSKANRLATVQNLRSSPKVISVDTEFSLSEVSNREMSTAPRVSASIFQDDKAGVSSLTARLSSARSGEGRGEPPDEGSRARIFADSTASDWHSAWSVTSASHILSAVEAKGWIGTFEDAAFPPHRESLRRGRETSPHSAKRDGWSPLDGSHEP